MAVFTRNFVLLWQGQLVSHLGNQAFLIATTLYVLQVTGSTTLVAGAMMAATIPLVVVGPIGGTAADRYSRRSILVLSDFSRAIAIGGLASVLLWTPGLASRHIILIIAVAAFNGIMSALFAPAFQALVPDLVPNDRLATANAINQMSTQTSTLIGQALGGVLFVAWGPASLLLLDAASFAYAGIATWLLPPDRPRAHVRTGIRRGIARYAADTRAGIAYVWRRRGMAAVLGIFAGVNCLFMPVFVLLPFYTREVLGTGPEWYGLLLSASGMGAMAGSVVAGVTLRRIPAHAAVVRGCLAGVAAGVLLLAATASTWVALAAFIGIGALSSIINVTVLTGFQSAVPPDVRGRVMALVIALSTAAAPLGMGLGGMLGDHWRSSLHLVFAGSGIAIASLAIVSSVLRGFGSVFERVAGEGDSRTEHAELERTAAHDR
jgi:MFS transporter, DHA3 family, macrolide efflux protein